jgi:probable F420-dependent oxidoreductase
MAPTRSNGRASNVAVFVFATGTPRYSRAFEDREKGMKVAITLPQLGRAANIQSLIDTATLAEELGYSDVWANDHIGFAANTDHAAPRMYDPLTCLAIAASATSRIGLGSHINAAYYPPVYLAKMLASLDSLSSGRVRITIGVGWQPEEFAVMGSDFKTRGKRTDEIIAILRSCWETGSSEHAGEFYDFPALKLSPRPALPIPIWIGGMSPAALRRAVRLGDGYQGLPTHQEPVSHGRQTGVSEIAALVRTLREARPDPEDFQVAMYTHEWDPADRDPDAIRREYDLFEQAGVQHVTIALARTDSKAWLSSVEQIARILSLPGG